MAKDPWNWAELSRERLGRAKPWTVPQTTYRFGHGEWGDHRVLSGQRGCGPPRVKCKDTHMAKRKLRAAVGQGIQEVLPERHQLVLIPPLTETDIFQGCISEDGGIYADTRNSIKCENWVLRSFPSTLLDPLCIRWTDCLFSSIFFLTHTSAHQISFSLANDHIIVEFAFRDPRQSTWQLQGKQHAAWPQCFTLYDWTWKADCPAPLKRTQGICYSTLSSALYSKTILYKSQKLLIQTFYEYPTSLLLRKRSNKRKQEEII